MSFLTPLYIAGALAVVLPIIFHLIRRTPRNRVPFSSLLFLSESPPRVTRRSRVEHLLLLLLRGLALVLIALAFARPFLREPVQADVGSAEGRLLGILIDTSASMRRADLWPQAIERARQALNQTTALDQVALFSFDREVRPLIDFEQWTEATAASRIPLALQRLEDLSPTWAATDLGAALATVADHLDSRASRESATRRLKQLHIVLISDLAAGSQLKALNQFEWPENVRVQVETVTTQSSTNAGIHLVLDRQEQLLDAGDAVRARISNSADSQRDRFHVRWAGAGDEVEVYVPPGRSRVVTMPTPPTQGPADEILLEGDDHVFDNRAFVVSQPPRTIPVLFVGRGEADDSRAPRYFLERALPQSRSRAIQLAVRQPNEPLLPADVSGVRLVIVSDEISREAAATLRQLMLDGSTVLAVLSSVTAGNSYGPLAAAEHWTVTEAPVTDYVMLEDIDFSHPLFRPMADPQFSDFTKIHFWKHRSLDLSQLPSPRLLARFDDREPALVEVPVGAGRLLLLTAGWHPQDSQLAVSTKFVPLLAGLVQQALGESDMPWHYAVGDAVPIPAGETWRVRRPDGTETEAIDPSQHEFTATDQPGPYTLMSAAAAKQFAVNLDPDESLTAAMPVEELEQLGVRLTSTRDLRKIELEKTTSRQLLAIELEGRQKFWRWLLLGALMLLIAETWLAGRLTLSRRPQGT